MDNSATRSGKGSLPTQSCKDQANVVFPILFFCVLAIGFPPSGKHKHCTGFSLFQHEQTSNQRSEVSESRSFSVYFVMLLGLK